MKTNNLSHRRKQDGVIIFIALIMLVAMSLAGIALMRTVSGGVMLAGNLSMKATTTRASDFAMESAAEWIGGNEALLSAGTPGYSQGYSPIMNGSGAFVADTQGHFDAVRQTEAFWETNAEDLPMPADLSDFEAKYVIHRMCRDPGPPDQNCVTFPGGSQQCSEAACQGTGGAGRRVLYRVSIYITGPKNTESFVQVMMY